MHVAARSNAGAALYLIPPRAPATLWRAWDKSGIIASRHSGGGVIKQQPGETAIHERTEEKTGTRPGCTARS